MATKKRVEVKAAPSVLGLTGSQSASTVVVEEKPGSVTPIDKVKAYYHSMIVLVGSLLVGANQALPLVPGDAKGWLSGAIAALTIIATVLKSNETWIDGI